MSAAHLSPALLVFAISWALIAFRRLRWLPIGRPAGALAGAVAMVAVGAETPEQAFAAVDGGTIALLLGMMLVTAYLMRAGLFGWCADRILAAAKTPQRLLIALAWSAAALSAVLVNDTVCLFMTPLVLAVVRRTGIPAGPFLVALATSANLGSAATLVGNPQNMLIGSMSGIRFAAFTGAVLPAVLVGMVVHTAVLVASYGGRLRGLPAFDPAPTAVLAPDAPLVGAVFLAVVAAFGAGFHLGFAALGGAVALMILDRREPDEAFAAVDWSVLLFFAGLFVIVDGLARTGLPTAAWAAVSPALGLSGSGLAATTAALALGSNLVSNVPLVLLVGDHLAALGDPALSWPLLAFVTTVAGNLTLVGSVANVIVAEQARDDYDLGFFEYLRVGAPSTVAVLAVGVPILAWWV
ncbi:MAG: SLC13 family permease [Myxococcota bacterium]